MHASLAAPLRHCQKKHTHLDLDKTFEAHSMLSHDHVISVFCQVETTAFQGSVARPEEWLQCDQTMGKGPAHFWFSSQTGGMAAIRSNNGYGSCPFLVQ